MQQLLLSTHASLISRCVKNILKIIFEQKFWGAPGFMRVSVYICQVMTLLWRWAKVCDGATAADSINSNVCCCCPFWLVSSWYCCLKWKFCFWYYLLLNVCYRANAFAFITYWYDYSFSLFRLMDFFLRRYEFENCVFKKNRF